MKHIIRADLYRIVRGKALYITFGVLIAYVFLQIFAMQQVVMYIETSGPEGTFREETTMLEMQGFDKLNGVNGARFMANQAGDLSYFLLPLMIVVAAPMFSHGTVKNSLALGLSRTKMYLTKMALSSAFCVLLWVIYMAFGVFFATLFKGFGAVPDGFWLTMLRIFAMQIWLIWDLNAVGIFLVFTTKRSAAVCGAFIGFCLVPSIILQLLSLVYDWAKKIMGYDLISLIQKVSAPGLAAREYALSLVVGAAFFLAATVGGVLLFKRAEIK